MHTQTLGTTSSKTLEKGIPVTICYGDGIGPEIMHAVLNILDAAGANIAPETFTPSTANQDFHW